MSIKFEDLNDEEKYMAKLMVAKAANKFVYPTENLFAIARARVRMKLDINTCPCAKDDKDRGCISAKCYREIQDNNVCHCNCYRKYADGSQKE